MSKKYPEFEVIESDDFPDAWVRAVKVNLNNGFESNDAQESIMVVVLRGNAIKQVKNHVVHPQYPLGKYAINAYCEEYTYDYLKNYLNYPEEKKFSYLYFERFVRYPTSMHYSNYIDQISYLHESLRITNNSRQLQMITYIPEIDMWSENPPCLQRIQVRQISDGVVDIHLDFRSWDVYGAMPSNIIAIIEMLINYVLNDDYDINSIIIISRSGHVYNNDSDAAKKVKRIPIWQG